MADPRTSFDCLEKGLPHGPPVAAEEVRAKNWNVRRGDLPLPSLTLRDSALSHNIAVMSAWCTRRGYLLAPHGKTSMAPRIFERQLEAGAWAITVATASQAAVCFPSGVQRILIANQITGAGNLRLLAGAAREHAGVELYCLVDSVAGANQLARNWQAAGAPRPLGALIEFGRARWRTGVRSRAAGLEVLRSIGAHPNVLRFDGIEAFEGSAANAGEAEGFLREVIDAAADFPSDGSAPPLFSVGGSAFLDVLCRALDSLPRPWQPVLRSGCYATHDHGFYAARHAGWGSDLPHFRAALELWAYVQSLPDPQLAILSFGKRDCAYDLGLPVPLDVPGGAVSALNDQHAFLTYPKDVVLEIGQILRFGISHPCTAFDKWRVLPVLDDEDNVIDLYRTFF